MKPHVIAGAVLVALALVIAGAILFDNKPATATSAAPPEDRDCGLWTTGMQADTNTCDSPESTQEFYKRTLNRVLQYHRSLELTTPEPEWFYIPTGTGSAPRCDDPNERTTPDDMLAAYCYDGNAVIVGERALGRFLQYGKAAAALVVAHEWAHSVQSQQGIVRDVRDASRFELQADCIAGTWLRWASARNGLTHGDREGIERLVADMSGTEHGTGQQRIEAVLHGYNSTYSACNDYGFELKLPGS